MTLEPERRLWFDSTIVPGIDALRKKLRAWLVQLAHPEGDDIVLSLLGLLAYDAERGVSLIDQILKLEGTFVEAETSHFVVLPGPAATASNAQTQLRHDGFSLGPLNDSLLKSRCNRAGSDFFTRYGAQLLGSYAVESPVYRRRLMDWASFLNDQPRMTIESRAYQLVLDYYEAMARYHLDMMWHDFSEKQLLYVGLGHSILNVRQFSREIGTQRITVYLGLTGKKKNAGYVVPTSSQRTFYIPPPTKQAAKLEALQHQYALKSLAGSALYPLLQSVCRSVEQADTFRSEERPDEAFLYSVIALEQVFSERENTTKAVSGRTAMLVHRQLKMDYPAAQRRIEELYDLRSRFVHDGKPVPIGKNLEIAPVVLAVIRSLIHLCRQQESASAEFKKSWLKRLDYLVAGVGAGKPPSEADLMENGILPSEEDSP